MDVQQIIAGLPSHLRERTRLISSLVEDSHPQVSDSGFVLYWMCTAMRVDENPALDVASLCAEKLNQPWLIYQGLSSRYRYASDRHHAFILQGARDVQAECQRLSLPYVFNLETSDKRSRSMLLELASQASLIVVEEMPTDPPRDFLAALKRQVGGAIIAVDTACVVPMQLVGKSYERAFSFREATERLRVARVAAKYPELSCHPKAIEPKSFGVESIDLQTANLAALISECDIDHSIPPVSHTIGGSKAGYERWQSFKRSGLSKYAKLRNSVLVDGVSRLSAYLHYGMISPLRIAREAFQYGGSGAEKFLDELLIWRELAYAFCFFNPHHETLKAVPGWARETLAHHEDDNRPQLYQWDELAHAETQDALWNAAQKSLLLNGELHNNVRMTWGKAILNWTSNADQSLQMLIDLNHRYALDGRDPASFGGILWCLGQFDRPFQPEQPIIGTVRPRPTAEHALRLSPTAFESNILSKCNRRKNIAVVGAGMSGLMAASILARQGFSVTLFDKSRGPAGRMSTRRGEVAEFDHGAQYFTARSELFSRYVDSWHKSGVIQLWEAPVAAFDNGHRGEDSVHRRFVGCPSMNSLGKHLLSKFMLQPTAKVHLETHVQHIARSQPGQQNQEFDSLRWGLLDDGEHHLGYFDEVIVTVPAPQALNLFSRDDALLSECLSKLSSVQYDPCWAAMLTLDKPLNVDWGGAFINSGAIRWVARNQTKPKRKSTLESVVIHASSQFSREHFETHADRVIELLTEELWQSINHPAITVALAEAHRWRYSISQNVEQYGVVSEASSSLHFCGDWSHGSRVEGAFLAGVDAAGKVMRQNVSYVASSPETEFNDLPLFRS